MKEWKTEYLMALRSYSTIHEKLMYLENELNLELFILEKHSIDWDKEETRKHLEVINWLEKKYDEVKGGKSC